MKKEILRGIIISVSFSITTLLTMVGYAAWISNLGGKNTGDVITAQTWNDLVNNVESLNSSYIPSGAIMAFNLSSCPSGWTEFTQAKGKTLVGVGNGTDINSYSTGFTLLQQGGEYRHQLNIAEMPSHRHSPSGGSNYAFGVGSNEGLGTWGWFAPMGGGTWLNSGFSYFTDYQGGGGSHNNIQPYVAILYCIKN